MKVAQHLTVNQRFVLAEWLQRWDRRVTREIDKYLQARAKLAGIGKSSTASRGSGRVWRKWSSRMIGVQMQAVFRSDAHLPVGAGICPGNKATGGKRLSGRTRKGNTY